MMNLKRAPVLVLILITLYPLAASAEEASIDCALFKNYSEESVGDFKSEPLLPAWAGDEWVHYESAKKAPAPSPVSSGSSAPGH